MLKTIENIGSSEKGLQKKTIPLVGFSEETANSFGEIVIPTYAGGINNQGIEASTEQIKAVLQLESPEKPKDVQRLAGKVAALSRFISRSSDKCGLFYNILRKSQRFEWTAEHEKAFRELKHYLSTPPFLSKPEHGKPLFLYLAVTEVAVSAVLVREQNKEQRIRSLDTRNVASSRVGSQRPAARESKMIAYMKVAKELKQKFRDYKLKQVLRDHNVEADDLATLRENFKPTELASIPTVHVLESSIQKVEEADKGELEDQQDGATVLSSTDDQSADQDWYTSYLDWLRHGKLPYDKKEIRGFKKKASRFTLINNVLFRKSLAGPYLRCLDKQKAYTVLHALHSGECGNHAGCRSLSKKSLGQGYFWPTMRADSTEYARKCDACQRFGIPSEIICVNGSQFLSNDTEGYCARWNISLKKSPPRTPKSNEQAESSNKIIMENLRRRLQELGGKRVDELPLVLWSDRTTPKTATC
ncbi:uncharacterized protein LOC141590844 [Silene latifolia]|uniref:uncharacterized protein LOC141590844 n=1 Tax=Silene latifolia TaxID=37657 RepID=UPI003D771BC0